MYNEVQQKVYEELQQAPNICLTTDIWTSQANQAYMTIIAHFIDLKNNKIKNVVLVRRELIGNHTIEFIVEQLENTRSTGSIGEKIICLAFDTYPTMRKVLLCTVLYPHWKSFQRSAYKNYVERLSLLNKLQAFEAKPLAYLYLQEQYNSLLENNLVTSSFNIQQHEEKEKEFDLFDIMITNRNIPSSNNRKSELLMYENEREIYRNANPLE
ncbi:unnamed protein product [Rotaria sordida]|uniref:Uncharacterized protein n=1 Tax=Rotaria sordida TaxID=392033 RepID=A0A813Z8W0_9BILA|nr:unnamed protein product [Rotaria sordida]CAF1405707.1 unnamed protein product [Rotaria sordida]